MTCRLAGATLTLVLMAHAASAQDSSALKLRLTLEEGAHVGRRAPPVVLPYATADSAGPVNQPFDLRKEIDRVVVLIFYPGDAAAGSADQWRAIAAHEGGNGRDVLIVGISPDSIAAQVRFARELSLPFKLLSDRSLTVARRYGAVTGRAIVPFVVVVGRGGRLRFVDSAFDARSGQSFARLDAAIRSARKLQ